MPSERPEVRRLKSATTRLIRSRAWPRLVVGTTLFAGPPRSAKTGRRSVRPASSFAETVERRSTVERTLAAVSGSKAELSLSEADRMLATAGRRSDSFSAMTRLIPLAAAEMFRPVSPIVSRKSSSFSAFLATLAKPLAASSMALRVPPTFSNAAVAAARALDGSGATSPLDHRGGLGPRSRPWPRNPDPVPGRRSIARRHRSATRVTRGTEPLP